ncbi:unnamed protein product [Coffea canephora]|uniref:MLO-like protein n=2 Tax=Coffea TaxID=13442 RepID=A0A068UEY0_COFCA|nr:unnamed protein product [Coffea canephora]
MAAGGGRSLEETPTWAVAVVCFVLVALSIIIECVIHLIEKWLTKRNRRALCEALEKIKSELMLLGFMSLLLTIGQGPISEICISKSLGNTWHPCNKKQEHSRHDIDADKEASGHRRLLAFPESSYGQRRVLAAAGYDKSLLGKVPFVSSDGIHQLHIFIFVLAVFHVLYCITTYALGTAKMRMWKAWEMETRTSEYQFAQDPERFRFARDTSFGRRHLSFWSHSTILLWTVSFFRQFVRSVPKVDYLTLRYGFIIAHLAPQNQANFDFQQYIKRSLEEDFKVVVGISPLIWLFAVLFLLFNTHGWQSYLWLPFIPLIIILLVGTKLQVIITKMGLRIQERGEVVQGTPLVQPADDLFWFNRPRVLLYLIHFVLFQNAFQLALFVWSWYEYGFQSCFHENTKDVAIGISMGVLIQILCSYVTLPLYALVTQMGSTMKPTIFNKNVAKALHTWHQTARKHIKQKCHSDSVGPVSSQPSTPLQGTSPVHLLHYYKNEIDSVETSSRISSYNTQPWEKGSPQLSCLQNDPSSTQQARNNHTIEGRVASEQVKNKEGLVPQTHLFQHKVDIPSADF